MQIPHHLWLYIPRYRHNPPGELLFIIYNRKSLKTFFDISELFNWNINWFSVHKCYFKEMVVFFFFLFNIFFLIYFLNQNTIGLSLHKFHTWMVIFFKNYLLRIPTVSRVVVGKIQQSWKKQTQSVVYHGRFTILKHTQYL